MMTMAGNDVSLWFRLREADIILETEDDEDGEGKLLRILFARCDEERDFQSFSVSNDGEEWQRTIR